MDRRQIVFCAGSAVLGVTGGPANAAGIEPIEIDADPPELTGGPWLNSKPLTLASLKGKVTVVHFWTFGCINCQRNLPSYGRWQKEFKEQGVTIIGIHTPETEAEKKVDNVREALKERAITYPVLFDGDGANWRRWNQHWWPTVYLIDKQGGGRYRWEGELDWKGAGGEAKMARKISLLLREK